LRLKIDVDPTCWLPVGQTERLLKFHSSNYQVSLRLDLIPLVAGELKVPGIILTTFSSSSSMMIQNNNNNNNMNTNSYGGSSIVDHMGMLSSDHIGCEVEKIVPVDLVVSQTAIIVRN
jgi:hypothetical protein